MEKTSLSKVFKNLNLRCSRCLTPPTTLKKQATKDQRESEQAELGLNNLLPMELLTEILSRISSVKTLLQCKCVCKSWLSLINDESFINLHLSRQLSSISKTNDYNFILCSSSINRDDLRTSASLGDDISFSIHNAKTLNELCVYKPSLLSQVNGTKDVLQINTCNGLLLIYFYETYLNFLCNPATGHIRQLPLGPWCRMSIIYQIGFGYDHLTSDYKVVFIYRDYKLLENVVSVYSLATDSWRKLDNIFPSGPNHDLLNPFSKCVVIDGFLNWLGFGCILAFDIGREVFEVMILPSYIKVRQNIKLGDVKGRLVALAHDYYDDVIDLWVMEEYGLAESWIKKLSIKLQTILYRPVALGYDGKILLRVNGSSIVYFDPWKKQFLGSLFTKKVDWFGFRFASYIETLVPIVKGRKNFI